MTFFGSLILRSAFGKRKRIRLDGYFWLGIDPVQQKLVRRMLGLGYV